MIVNKIKNNKNNKKREEIMYQILKVSHYYTGFERLNKRKLKIGS